MGSISTASEDRELAHALMAVLRFRYQASSGRRVSRGSSPQQIGGASSPWASGALLDVRTGRVVVAAEAVGASATHASVEGAIDRAVRLAVYARSRHDDSVGPGPEIWICAPHGAQRVLAREYPLPDVLWVGYDVMPFDVPPLDFGGDRNEQTGAADTTLYTAAPLR